MKKRTIALLLSLILSFGLVGAAFADDGDWYWTEDGIPVQSAAPSTPPPTNPGNSGSNSGGGYYGGSSPSYNVSNGNGSSPGGSWSVDKTTARKNDLVTITVKPDPGMAAGIPEVSGPKGESILVRELGNGKFGFTMPDGSVIVGVKFSPVNPFVDVSEGEYYYDAVLWAAASGITTGTDDTHFSPGSPCTRAQIVTFLWRANGKPSAADVGNPFVDVSPASTPGDYYEAILWAVSKGITTGTDETHFSPGTACTRAQAMTFLWRAEGSPAVSGGDSFSDVEDSAYYAGAVNWAVSRKITTGTDETHFSPGSICVRAQIVTFLYRNKA